ncbi:hypothetical protein OEZ85_005967 [Tetradesmus obliquus]|uniref:FAD dependent oxidoreductase domain-containing protein n=1 Tax=Tetradesmus obliquus TaxID=3088 RepID=A0ABY8UIW0_TETOB|nr:hypothetical protein OEZ85_005967 [Tetradesmus obliquus]
MAGLAAAEVLSRHFSHVVVLERDQPHPEWQQGAVDMAKSKVARRGVTQYNHLHGMTAGGLASLNRIFGGRYSPALEAAGTPMLQLFKHARLVHPTYGCWLPRNASAAPVATAFCTRHMFESTARQLVAGNERVEFVHGAKAVGLQFEEDAGAAAAAAEPSTRGQKSVTGVLLADGSFLQAGLVVDASGRHSAAPDWLAAAGFPQPRVSHATAGCSYASTLVKLSPEAESALAAAEVRIIYAMAHAPEKSLGILAQAENGVWQTSVGGFGDKTPPLKDDGIFDWAKKEVWHPSIAALLEGCTPLIPWRRFYGLGSTWRHYEEAAAAGNLPEGLLLLADSICSFQPVYGQGMTVAALEAEILDELLEKRSSSSSSSSSSSTTSYIEVTGLAAELQAAVQPVVQAAWDLAVGGDMKYEGAVSSDGPVATGLAGKLMGAYMEALFELATSDETAQEALLRVMHMLDPPAKVMEPPVLSRVLLHLITAPFRPAAGPNAAFLSSSSSSKPASRVGGAAQAAAAVRASAAGGGRFDLGVNI